MTEQLGLFSEPSECTCPSEEDYDPRCPRHGAEPSGAGTEAAQRTSKKMQAKQQAVLRVLARIGPSTDIELVDAYPYHVREHGEPPQQGDGIRTRRDELRRQGLVVDTGLKRKTASGKSAIVWAARDKAGEVMSKPADAQRN